MAKWLVVWALEFPPSCFLLERSRTQILGSSFRDDGGLQDQATQFPIWTPQIWTYKACAVKDHSLLICKVGIIAAHASKICLED